MSGIDSKARAGTASVGDWLARAAFLLVGAAVGAVSGILLLVAAVAVFWLACMALSEGSNSNTGALPKGAWKIVLAVVASVGFTVGCYCLGGWQGVLVGGAIVGGFCGGIVGLAARSRQEKNRRLRETH